MEEKRDKINLLLNMLLILFILIFFVAAIPLVSYFSKGVKQNKMNRELVTLRTEHLAGKPQKSDNESDTVGEVLDDVEMYRETAEMFRQMNPDYVCFLTLDEENMYPVVQRDNEYYLKTNFYGEKNSRGAIFLDEKCKTDDAIYLIHGHHMKDRSMFGCLNRYMEADYREKNKQIFVDFGDGNQAYEIFAIGLFDLASQDHFRYYELPGTENLQDYVKKFCDLSWWCDDVSSLQLSLDDVEKENQTPKIVLLSTCEYHGEDQRLVIAAIRK